jgi:23S rRNA (cytidine1920-2'-O)/16S rRNA (cytidine1409-2'-O)-methyltransferase
LAESRTDAAGLIQAGAVLVNGAVAERPARLVGPAEAVTVTGPKPRFVSRGGDKLDAALDHFGIEVAGRRALDAGASTGGFTDCLLQRGAAHVVAVDVGRAQLHEKLQADGRVTLLDRTNIRLADLHDVAGGGFDLVVADLSFISLATVGSRLVRWTAATGDLVVLVKPQFEAGRREAARGRGVIRDPGVWRAALEHVISAFADAGAAMMGVMLSPLRGAGGNVEFLAHFRLRSAREEALASDGAPALDVGAAIDRAVSLAGAMGESGPDARGSR